MRVTETWTCMNCGHSSTKLVVHPKRGASATQLVFKAMRGRCTCCGVRGQCTIKESEPVRLALQQRLGQ